MPATGGQPAVTADNHLDGGASQWHLKMAVISDIMATGE